MDVWQVVPKKSVGPLSLDAQIDEIEAILGGNFDRFRRGENPNEILAFDAQGIHVEIGEDGRTQSVSLFLPICIALKNVDLLGRDFSEVKRDLDSAGLTFESVDAGLWNEELLIMLVEHDKRIDSVEVRRIPY